MLCCMIDVAAINDPCFTAFGESATYTPAGGAAQSVTVIRDRGVDLAPGVYGSNVSELRTVLHIRKTDVAAPARGDACVVDGTTYTLEAPIEDDGYIAKWVVL